MKKPKISLHNFGDDSGELHVCWKPSSVACTEALNELGVGFFSSKGELFSVIFDDVEWEKDHQILEFKNCSVEAIVNSGKINVKVHEKKNHRRKAA